MHPARLGRRAFLRALTLGTLGVAVACSSDEPTPGATSSPTDGGTGSSSPSPTERTLAWTRIPATGPAPRRDHTLTANDGGTIAFLFGGRARGSPLNDFWAFERESNTWERVTAAGAPSARFGHNAAFVDGHLVVFGGQNGPNSFLNDAWAFDPVRGTWSRLNAEGGPPAPRYGAGGTTIGTSLTITHGFTNSGRFDDTWALSSRWTNVSPLEGPRPVKRCLHRAVYLSDLGRMLLFGGQTDGRPFLGDTWLYDPASQGWSEVRSSGPSPRNLYALAGDGRAAYLFGGAGAQGATNDLWTFASNGWRRLDAGGTRPPARSGAEGAMVAGPSLLVFGGAGESGELDDLWELTLPG